MMSPEDVAWMLEFLKRTVTRGHEETEALLRVVEKLERAAGLIPATL